MPVHNTDSDRHRMTREIGLYIIHLADMNFIHA